MRSFRNNNRRSRYRSNGDRNFKRNGENHSFTSNANFQRKSPGRNNQNASKLIEKYTDLAREALSKGDKILSENYFQHADHFIRIQDEKEKSRIAQNDNSGKTSSEDHDKLEDQKSTEKTATSS
tara:strand:+ start:135 stop:506 length:372 start_codon:yes stop_codon:yes gene_type:complete